jgi:hypothetical protein
VVKNINNLHISAKDDDAGAKFSGSADSIKDKVEEAKTVEPAKASEVVDTDKARPAETKDQVTSTEPPKERRDSLRPRSQSQGGLQVAPFLSNFKVEEDGTIVQISVADMELKVSKPRHRNVPGFFAGRRTRSSTNRSRLTSEASQVDKTDKSGDNSGSGASDGKNGDKDGKKRRRSGRRRRRNNQQQLPQFDDRGYYDDSPRHYRNSDGYEYNHPIQDAGFRGGYRRNYQPQGYYQDGGYYGPHNYRDYSQPRPFYDNFSGNGGNGNYSYYGNRNFQPRRNYYNGDNYQPNRSQQFNGRRNSRSVRPVEIEVERQP